MRAIEAEKEEGFSSSSMRADRGGGERVETGRQEGKSEVSRGGDVGRDVLCHGMATVEISDRLAIRSRPSGPPAMMQRWSKLLFLHWPIDVDELRAHVPSRLEIDTFEGTAWIGMTPFTMPSIRPPGLPALPVVGQTHELNVRTYVHLDGVPGLWFFSLDANNPLAVLGARLGLSLPYYQARMSMSERDGRVRYSSRRAHPGAPGAAFQGEWTLGEPMAPLEPATLDFFLIERYCLYVARGRGVYRVRVHHRPWALREARLEALSSTMLQAAGLEAGGDAPLVHAQAAPLEVGVWWPRRV